MRIIHGKGYSEADRLQFRSLVYQNIHTAVISLIRAVNMLEICYEDQGISTEVNNVLLINTDTLEEFSDENKHIITRFWADPSVQQCYERRREYQLSDSAK